jgi:hypothetical protein
MGAAENPVRRRVWDNSSATPVPSLLARMPYGNNRLAYPLNIRWLRLTPGSRRLRRKRGCGQ